jgi:hypothetical protein
VHRLLYHLGDDSRDTHIAVGAPAIALPVEKEAVQAVEIECAVHQENAKILF